MAIPSEMHDKCSIILKDLLPESGEARGNITVLKSFKRKIKDQLKISIVDSDYWEVRNKLIESGTLAKARGKGGAIRLIVEKPKTGSSSKKTPERQLYDPFIAYVRDIWVGDKDIGADYIVEKTAEQGKKRTGGKWTRPDVTVVVIRTYTFTPGRHLEVVTFEIKADGHYDVSGVFETASHSVFANKSYLAVNCSQGRPETEEFERLELLCKQFGVGLIVFESASKSETYEEIVEPERKIPDPSLVDDFILRQITPANQARLHKMLK